MGAVGPGLEFGMVLGADHERMVGNFTGLNQVSVGRKAAYDQTGILQRLPVAIVKFKTVPVPLHYGVGTVGRFGQSLVLWMAGVIPQPHGATLA